MARHWRRPGAPAVLLTCAGIALFIGLATWQLRRARDKTALFAAFAHATEQTPVSLDQARRATKPVRVPLVRVSGRYDPQHAYVLDNQVRDGRAGVMLFDVFEPADGGVPVLVNRGFLARDARGARPVVPPPPAGRQELTALYAAAPGTGLRLGGDALPAQQAWPKTSIYIDPAEISRDLGRKLDSRVLLLLPAAGSAFVREWTPQVFPPQRHLGYAFTWFTFAAVAVVIFVSLHWRKDEPSQ